MFLTLCWSAGFALWKCFCIPRIAAQICWSGVQDWQSTMQGPQTQNDTFPALPTPIGGALVVQHVRLCFCFWLLSILKLYCWKVSRFLRAEVWELHCILLCLGCRDCNKLLVCVSVWVFQHRSRYHHSMLMFLGKELLDSNIGRLLKFSMQSGLYGMHVNLKALRFTRGYINSSYTRPWWR